MNPQRRPKGESPSAQRDGSRAGRVTRRLDESRARGAVTSR
jgi:hypothetical protein